MSTTLVVLAAGMGSRYGGCKQIDPIGPNGEIILELSVYDAIQAGFDRVVFIIKKAIEKDFKEAIGNKLSEKVECVYVYQEMDALPEGCQVVEGRTKPYGTAHALWCCKDVLDGPFALINSDDYYGQSCFKTLYEFLNNKASKNHYGMVGYVLANTLTDHGSVARGQCMIEEGKLKNIVERTHIEKKDGKVMYCLDDKWYDLAPETLVSMNMWAFTADIMEVVEKKLIHFLQTEIQANPMKAEIYIPNVVGEMLSEQICDVAMMESHDRWYGVTYQEDKESVKKGIAALYAQGKYPQPLWKK